MTPRPSPRLPDPALLVRDIGTADYLVLVPDEARKASSWATVARLTRQQIVSAYAAADPRGASETQPGPIPTGLDHPRRTKPAARRGIAKAGKAAKAAKGSRAAPVTLSADVRREIVTALDRGDSAADLADLHRVHISTIYRVRDGARSAKP